MLYGYKFSNAPIIFAVRMVIFCNKFLSWCTNFLTQCSKVGSFILKLMKIINVSINIAKQFKKKNTHTQSKTNKVKVVNYIFWIKCRMASEFWDWVLPITCKLQVIFLFIYLLLLFFSILSFSFVCCLKRHASSQFPFACLLLLPFPPLKYDILNFV